MVLSTALFSIGASSAVAQAVRYNFAWDAEFKKFKTYKWVEIKDAQKVDEATDKEIKGALDAQLSKKRLARVNAVESTIEHNAISFMRSFAS